jgi:hypothetical protein
LSLLFLFSIDQVFVPLPFPTGDFSAPKCLTTPAITKYSHTCSIFSLTSRILPVLLPSLRANHGWLSLRVPYTTPTVDYIPLGIAIRYILGALTCRPDSNLFKFGPQALSHFESRLSEWQPLCQAFLRLPHLMEAHPELSGSIHRAIASAGDGSDSKVDLQSLAVRIGAEPLTVFARPSRKQCGGATGGCDGPNSFHHQQFGPKQFRCEAVGDAQSPYRRVSSPPLGSDPIKHGARDLLQQTVPC